MGRICKIPATTVMSVFLRSLLSSEGGKASGRPFLPQTVVRTLPPPAQAEISGLAASPLLCKVSSFVRDEDTLHDSRLEGWPEGHFTALFPVFLQSLSGDSAPNYKFRLLDDV